MNATCRRTAGWFAALLLCLSACPTSGLAADDSEALTRRARNSGGLQGGAWQVADLSAAPGGTDSHTASIEGWFQKGLDLHLAIETTLGFWQRTQTVTQSGTLGTQSQTEMQSYFVPTLTTLKLYPATLPSAPLEPYIAAGAGPVLEMDHQKVTSTDPTVPAGETSSLHTGLGLVAGAGLEWNPGGPFGATAGGRYQWATFGESAGGRRMYRGPGFSAGVIYHFQYK
jgi:hypothetical protein